MEENEVSKRDCVRRSTHLGPYRATKLWNDLVRSFRNGMPVGRHWRHMKTYDDCFSATEAVSWLHSHLQTNPNFGPNITRVQTVLLLEKFYKTKIFEDVRNKSSKNEFAEGGRLFRFVSESPVKSKSSSTRVPLSTRTSLMNSASSPEVSKPSKIPIKEQSKLAEKLSRSKSFLKRKENIKISNTVKKEEPSEVDIKRKEEKDIARLTVVEVESIWKNMFLLRFRTVLHLATLADILNIDAINVHHLIHNMTQVNKNGIVSNIDKKDQLPDWVVSAMRCLAYWPQQVGDLPHYDGFDRDVFTVVKDYFCSLDEPLIAFDMYDIFTNVMATLEEQNQIEVSPVVSVPQPGSGVETTGPSPICINSYTSLENLMADLTMNAPSTALSVPPGDVIIVHDPDSVQQLSNMPDVVRTHSGLNQTNQVRPFSRYNSASSLPGAKLETSFGILGEEPETKLVRKQISPTYLNRGHSTLLTPSSASSSQGSNSAFLPLARHGGSRASVKSAEFVGSSKSSQYNYIPMNGGGLMKSHHYSVPTSGATGSYPYSSTAAVPRYGGYLDRKQRVCSASTVQSSYGGSEADTSSPNYSQRSSSTSSGGSSRQPAPRTCPDQGVYPIVSKSCMSLLNNVVARSNPVNIIPQPDSSSRASQTSGSASGLNRQSPNTSASSYDTAYSNLSGNKDSFSLSNNSKSRSSVGSTGVLNTRADSLSSSVFGSSEVKRTSPSVDALYIKKRPSSGDVFQKPSPLVDDFSNLRVNKRSCHGSMCSVDSSRVQRKAPVLCLQESYRLAVEGDRAMATPVGRSLFSAKTLSKSESSPNLRSILSPKPRSRTLEALQLCTLMLAPPSRRKLHLLLRLMHKMVNSSELNLDPERPIRTVVLETFAKCVLRSPDEIDFKEMLSLQIVGFMMDNYVELMKVSTHLKERIDDKINQLRKTKSQSLASGTMTSEEVAEQLSYCQQMSLQEYESQRMSSSQLAIVDLLEDIVKDRNMSAKDKKKRLKQFQRHYPDIYSQRFPSSQSESELFPEKPRIKPPLLTRPLRKLKNLRM